MKTRDAPGEKKVPIDIFQTLKDEVLRDRRS